MFLLFAVFLSVGFTQTPRPNDAHISSIKEINRKLPEKHVSIFALTLEQSKLFDVQQKLPGAKVYRQGEAGNNLSVLCYIGVDGTLLTYESGEMGGSDHLLNAFAVYGDKNAYRLSSYCGKSNLVNRRIKTAGGLHLGMKPEEVKKLFSKPSKETPQLMIYKYLHENTSSLLEIRLGKAGVTSFSVSKVTSK
jgi:hypothetical protein